jgi:hypothetical protein
MVGSNASLSGFGGGLATKTEQILVEIEGHTVRNLKIDPPHDKSNLMLSAKTAKNG